MSELEKLNIALSNLMESYKIKILELEKLNRIVNSLESENNNLKQSNKLISEKLSKLENNSNNISNEAELMIDKINGLLAGKNFDDSSKESNTIATKESVTNPKKNETEEKPSLSINASRFDSLLNG